MYIHIYYKYIPCFNRLVNTFSVILEKIALHEGIITDRIKIGIFFLVLKSCKHAISHQETSSILLIIIVGIMNIFIYILRWI